MSDDLRNLLTEYGRITDQIKSLEDATKPLNERKEEIKERLAEHLHAKRVRELILEDTNGREWKSYYRKTQKRVDHDLLLESVGQARYNEIVSQGECLVIGKAPKKKKKIDSMTQRAPIDVDGSLPPIGTITN